MIGCGCAGTVRNAPREVVSGESAVGELLAADRAFSGASAGTNLTAGLSAMFAPDVTMSIPPGKFAEGAAAATEALNGNPANAQARITWTPIRGGVSADGQHGFTFGYTSISAPNGTVTPGKYLAYWVKGPAGWRVAVYRRRARPPGEVNLALMPGVAPRRVIAASSDPAAMARFRESIDSVERAFSRDAQVIGLGPAFARYGRADAVNLGGQNDTSIVVGAARIALAVTGGDTSRTSPVTWAPDKVIVASSGDLGVTIGYLRLNAQPAGGGASPGIPFFTIWYRERLTDPWRYIAE